MENGYQVLFCKAVKTGTMKKHNHIDSIETVVVAKGQLTITTGKKKAVLHPGDATTIPVGVDHAVHGTKGSEFACLLIPPELIYRVG